MYILESTQEPVKVAHVLLVVHSYNIIYDTSCTSTIVRSKV